MEYLISTIFLVAAIASGKYELLFCMFEHIITIVLVASVGQMFPNAGVGPGIPSGKRVN